MRTYALVRHPSVLWFALLMAALALISRSRLALVAAPVWTGADVLYAWIQDRYLFPLMFPEYEDYQQQVPCSSQPEPALGAVFTRWDVRRPMRPEHIIDPSCSLGGQKHERGRLHE